MAFDKIKKVYENFKKVYENKYQKVFLENALMQIRELLNGLASGDRQALERTTSWVMNLLTSGDPKDRMAAAAFFLMAVEAKCEVDLEDLEGK